MKSLLPMKIKLLQLGQVIIITSLLFGISPVVHAATSAQLQSQRDILAREIDRNKQALDAKKKEAVQISGDLQNISTNIRATEDKISQTRENIQGTEASIGDITKEITVKENDLAKEFGDQREALRTIYETTEQNPVYILAGWDISDAIDRASYLEALEIQIESTIDNITKLRTDLVGRKSDMESKQRDLKKLKDQQEAYQRGLDDQKNQKSKMLGNVKIAQADFEKKLADAKKANAQVEAEINALARASRSSGSSSTIKSKDKGTSSVGFIWPIDYNYSTTEWGPTDDSYPFHSAAPFHYGLDIVNQVCGTPIYAAADGIVNLFSSSSGYGNHIIIGHNARFSTLYGHMQSFAVSDGQEVKQGQTIGYEGTTGWSTGCHVHFEVWDNGNRPNPRNYLP